VNLLLQAGYSQVYSVVDGFEGEMDLASGHRSVDGWRNAELPWTYRILPEQAYAPAQ
jgi:rhodanese-related sulfurtransferase